MKAKIVQVSFRMGWSVYRALGRAAGRESQTRAAFIKAAFLPTIREDIRQIEREDEMSKLVAKRSRIATAEVNAPPDARRAV